MVSVNPRELRYEGITLVDNDFVAGSDDATSLDAGQVGEVAVLEVGEDGQLSSYDALRLGDTASEIDQTKGRLFADLQDDSSTALPNNTQIRFAYRDKNSNRREPATEWFTIRDLDQDRPDFRKVLEPVTKNGSPWFLKFGRILSIEVKNEAESITFSLSNSEMEIPARGGF